MACDNLAGWPTASKVHFVTYELNSSSAQVAGTQLDCTGIVSGNTIGSIVVIDGTDTGNSVNDVVEMIPTAAWGQDLADALTNQHSRTGTHTVITATSLATTGNSSIGGNETITGNLAVTGTTTLTGATTITALSNPYKFSVYLTTGQNVGTGATIVTFDTKNFDTSSNLDIITNKGRFTAPVAGFYQFNARILTNSAGSGTGVVITLYKNGSIAVQGDFASVASGTSPGVSISEVLQLAANDFVDVRVLTGTAAKALDVSAPASNNGFSGFLISAT